MKKNIFFIAFLISHLFLYAQTPEALLDAVSATYKNNKSYFIAFESELQNKTANVKEKYTGEVYIKGNRYNLSIPKMNIKQIFDGKKLYTISNETEEVTVTTPESESQEVFTPTKVLDIYKKGYTITFDGKVNINGKSFSNIKLTPTTTSDVKYIMITVDTKNNEIKKIQEVNNNNSITTLSVTNQVNDIIIPKSLLTFNKRFFKNYFITEL